MLVCMLTRYGFDVQLRPLPLGYAGTIYKTNLTTCSVVRTTGRRHYQDPSTHCLSEAPHPRHYMPRQHRGLEKALRSIFGND